MTQKEPAPLPQVGANHYVALCGVCLGVIFLVQLEAGLLLTNLLVVLAGAMALVSRLRVGPVLLTGLVAAVQIYLQVRTGREQRTMELNDVLICAAVLGYVAGHYRLQGIWYQLLPTDARSRAGPPRRVLHWLPWRAPREQEKRARSQITPQEIALLVATLPVYAVVAQVARALIPQHWYALGLPSPLVQIMLVLWLLGVGFLVVGAFVNLWKHRHHDPTTAQLYLQDLLWRETRGEQRRVNRWLAWWARKQKPS